MRHAHAEIDEAARRFEQWDDPATRHMTPKIRELTPEQRHQIHLVLGDRGKCDERCTHEPYPPCPVCGEPA